MILLDNISQLPKHVIFKMVTGKVPCEDADYCYFHKSLMYYSCFFNIPVLEYKRKGKKK